MKGVQSPESPVHHAISLIFILAIFGTPLATFGATFNSFGIPDGEILYLPMVFEVHSWTAGIFCAGLDVNKCLQEIKLLTPLHAQKAVPMYLINYAIAFDRYFKRKEYSV